jgi:hypothetical protein
MSKCDNPISSPCPCFYLPFEQGCYDCVIAPWREYVSHQLQDVLGHYQKQHPHMMCEHILYDAVKSAAYKAIWKHHTEKSEERSCFLPLRKAIDDACDMFLSRRLTLMLTVVVPAVEEVIAQHFLFLTAKPDAPPTIIKGACPECAEDAPFEPFPPPQLREYLLENILPCIYNEPDYPEKEQIAKRMSYELVHKWLAATPEERVKMGV